MSEAWATTTVADCLVPVATAGKSRIQARDYKLTGSFPVIDQGQEKIAGWTDDETAVIDAPLPLVVFGDHTRTFKFLDLPFARGADGTQLLCPKPGIDPLFFFYACRAIDLPARGYNRHFTILKEKELAYPVDGQVQKAIAAVLLQTESVMTQQSMLLDTLQELKRAAMTRLFTRGLRGEAQKETEIGLVPESWEVTTLGSLCDQNGGRIQTGPFGSQLHAHEYQAAGIPVINPTHLEGNRINHADVPKVSAETACRLQRHKVEKGDILFGRRGEIGRHGLVSEAEAGWLCGTGCFLVRVRHTGVNNIFLSYLFSTESLVAWLVGHAAGTIMPNLNNVVLSRLPVVVPGIDEQREIVAILDAIDRKIALHRQKRAVLEELFQSLLHKLMTGTVRVADLDLSALPTTSAAA